jgi:beta-glucosidase-like glycosyl hydrolase
LNGEAAEPFRAQIEAGIRDVMAAYTGPEGVVAPSSTWIVTAVNPA